jgi:hypothetical protein
VGWARGGQGPSWAGPPADGEHEIILQCDLHRHWSISKSSLIWSVEKSTHTHTLSIPLILCVVLVRGIVCYQGVTGGAHNSRPL